MTEYSKIELFRVMKLLDNILEEMKGILNEDIAKDILETAMQNQTLWESNRGLDFPIDAFHVSEELARFEKECQLDDES